ncbi:hypothetical protein L3Y34_001231 [Caenorhabditis briggsae]|uniref:Uncharacterized protein n=1 Tax=Caenorhabditis briggsae TaxID=6238 RepID=A0AAE9IQR0_CAEBR|nr:hypothetical protein L3Y34_001231 [Caenorhabditis briggsae]
MSEIERLFKQNAINSDVIKKKLIELGESFLGGEWKNVTLDQVHVPRLLSGQSNYLYHVTSSTSATPYLLRIHRQERSQVFTDTVLFAILSERGLGPKLYGFFEGGRLEEYLPSEGFTEDDYWKPGFVQRIGAALPACHAMDIPVSKNVRCAKLMRDWLNGYKELEGGDYEILPTTVTYSDHPKTISVQKLSEEIDTFEKWAREVFEHTLVFGQIDFGVSNVLELNSTKEMVFIDCEFSSYNWRGFDLAMFVSESAITFNVPFPPGIKIIEDLTDNSPIIRILCEAYLDADNTLKNHIPSDRSSELESLIQECLFFWPLTHLFWALSAMKHALLKFENGVDLDVQARDRLAVYFHLKPRSQKIYEELKKWKKAL